MEIVTLCKKKKCTQHFIISGHLSRTHRDAANYQLIIYYYLLSLIQQNNEQCKTLQLQHLIIYRERFNVKFIKFLTHIPYFTKFHSRPDPYISSQSKFTPTFSVYETN